MQQHQRRICDRCSLDAKYHYSYSNEAWEDLYFCANHALESQNPNPNEKKFRIREDGSEQLTYNLEKITITKDTIENIVKLCGLMSYSKCFVDREKIIVCIRDKEEFHKTFGIFPQEMFGLKIVMRNY